MFSTYKVLTTVLKIGVEIGERFSLFLLSSQKLLYKTACVFIRLKGSGIVVVHNFHSQFWCSVIISAFLFHFRIVKQPYLKPKASFVKTKVISHFKQRTNEAENERKQM